MDLGNQKTILFDHRDDSDSNALLFDEFEQKEIKVNIQQQSKMDSKRQSPRMSGVDRKSMLPNIVNLSDLKMIESKKQIMVKNPEPVQLQEGSNTTSVPKTPMQGLAPRLSVIRNEFMVHMQEPSPTGRESNIKRKKKRRVVNKLVQSLNSRPLEKLSQNEIHTIKNQLENEFQTGLTGLAMEAVKNNASSSFSQSQTINSLLSPKHDRASIGVEDAGTQISSNRPFIGLEKSKIHQDNSINALNIRKHYQKQKTLVTPQNPKRFNRNTTLGFTQTQQRFQVEREDDDDLPFRQSQFSKFMQESQQAPISTANQSSKINRNEILLHQEYYATDRYEHLPTLRNSKQIMPGVFKRNTMRYDQVQCNQTQYKQIGQLKSVRNKDILEYNKSLNDRKSYMSNFKNHNFQKSTDFQSTQENRVGLVDQSSVQDTISLYPSRKQSQVSSMMKAKVIFSEQGQQEIKKRLAADSIDLDIAGIDLYSPLPADTHKTDIKSSKNSQQDDETIKITDAQLIEQDVQNQKYLPQNKRFFVGSKYVEVPHENLQELEAKHDRVNSLVNNLNFLKTQVTSHFVNKSKNDQLAVHLKKQQTLFSDSLSSCRENAHPQSTARRTQSTQSMKGASQETVVEQSPQQQSNFQKLIASRGSNEPFLFHKGGILRNSQESLAKDTTKRKGSVNENYSPGKVSEMSQVGKATEILINDDGNDERLMIKQVIVDLDRMKKARMQNLRASKQSQLAIIKHARPDPSLIINIMKQAKQQIDSRVEEEKGDIKNIMKIQGKQLKYAFQQGFLKNDVIQQVMLKDKDFAEKVKEAKDSTKSFLNDIFKDIQQGKEIVIDLEDQDERDVIQSELRQSASKKKRMTKLKDVVLRAMNRCNLTPEAVEKIMKKKAGDIHLIILMQKMYQSISRNIFQQGNIGQQFDNVGENIFQNDYLLRIQKAFINQGLKIDLELMPSHQRLQKQYQIDHYFTNKIKSQEFYEQTGSKIPKFQVEYEEMKEESRNQIEPWTSFHYQQLREKEEQYLIQKLLLEYYEFVKDHGEKPLPLFAQSPILTQNTLYLSEILLTEVQAKALKMYFQNSKNLPKCHVRNLIIDDCGIKDQNFAIMLEGVREQGYLQKLVYSNNELGQKSIEQLQHIIPNLIDLELNNLTGGISKSDLKVLVDHIKTQPGKILMKLKLSGINLSDEHVVQSLCEIIRENNGNLSDIDFSWASLKSDHMYKLLEALNQQITEHPLGMRCLNISYNSLYFGKNCPGKENKHQLNQVESSNKFLDSLIKFLQQSNDLKHIDLSGMGFGQQQIRKLAVDGFISSKSLIAIHLSDNGLSFDQEFLEEFIDFFGMGPQVLQPDAAHSHSTNTQVTHPEVIKKLVQSFSKTVDKDKVLSNDKVNTQNYKTHLLRSKQGKAIEINKGMNSTKIANGLGRCKDNQVDQIILHRKINYPELIFNQHAHIDKYFMVDSELKWSLKTSNDCFYCQRYQYTAIFYDQGNGSLSLGNNPGLVEITDKEIVKSLSYNMGLSVRDQLTFAPFITGSIINGGYKRKLKMLRSDMFSLLSIIHSERYVNEQCLKDAINVKKGIVRITEKGQNIEVAGLEEKLQGWNKPLYQKINENQLTDITCINQPDNLQKQTPQGNTFVYAAYLPPGHHQFLIYCPVTDRAFCQNVVVNMNHFEFYPEYPRTSVKTQKKPKQNIWRTWEEDTPKSMANCHLNDCLSGNFHPNMFIKDQGTIDQVKEKFKDYYQDVQIFYQEMLIQSKKYPRIDADTLIYTYLDMAKDDPSPISHSFLEVAFISTTKTHKDKGLKGSLDRAAFLEMMLRCFQESNKMSKCSPTLAEHFDHAFSLYCKPVVLNSPIGIIRNCIRKSNQVNDALVQNKEQLLKLYVHHKVKKSGMFNFTFESALNLFGEGDRGLLSLLADDDLKRCFVSAKMTVVHEQQNGYKYHILSFVEFLDFLCRVTIRYHSNKCDHQWKGNTGGRFHKKSTATDSMDSRDKKRETQEEFNVDEDALKLLQVDPDMKYLQEIQGKRLYEWVTEVIQLLFQKYNSDIPDVSQHLNFMEIDPDSDYEDYNDDSANSKKRR